MKRKLIFFDVDGTIYDEQKKIPPSTLKALQLLKANGHILAIASGRAPFTLQQVMEDTSIKSFVSFNGQYVFHDNKVIYTNPLSIDALTELEQYARHNGHPLVFFSGEEAVSNIDFHHHIKDSLASIKLEHPRYAENYIEENEIYQALIFHEENEDVLYDGQYDALKFYRWHEVSRDVVPADGSKANGMKQLADQLGFSRDDCIAIGDGNNDFEMIEWAGTGIAMGNAVPGLKKIADYITSDVSKDGLYKAFVDLKLIEEEFDGQA